jgi:hypothetical protein
MAGKNRKVSSSRSLRQKYFSTKAEDDMSGDRQVVCSERIIRIHLDIVDYHGSQTPLACKVMDVYAKTAEKCPEFANASYMVAIETVGLQYYYLGRYCESHLEALEKALEGVPLTVGDGGECVVVGPCGFDDCRCDGEPYAMRWDFSVHAVVAQPAGEA